MEIKLTPEQAAEFIKHCPKCGQKLDWSEK